MSDTEAKEGHRGMWFKQRYVEAILRGEKTDTIRRASPRLPAIGAIVPASVGPVAPFADLTIENVEPVTPNELTPERRAEVEALIGLSAPLRRIRFRVARVYPNHAAHTRSASVRSSAGPT